MSGLIGLFLGFIALVVVLIIIAVLIKLAEEPKKQYGIASVTSNGENVRSIGEKKIADYFSRNNIKYVYEKATKHINYFNEAKLKSMLEEAGFRNISLSGYKQSVMVEMCNKEFDNTMPLMSLYMECEK